MLKRFGLKIIPIRSQPRQREGAVSQFSLKTRSMYIYVSKSTIIIMYKLEKLKLLTRTVASDPVL